MRRDLKLSSQWLHRVTELLFEAPWLCVGGREDALAVQPTGDAVLSLSVGNQACGPVPWVLMNKLRHRPDETDQDAPENI